MFDTKYATVQTAKQSCELLLKVRPDLKTNAYMLTCIPLEIIDSILDYSKLEASGNHFRCYPRINGLRLPN
jgi:hypothetical protein